MKPFADLRRLLVPAAALLLAGLLTACQDGPAAAPGGASGPPRSGGGSAGGSGGSGSGGAGALPEVGVLRLAAQDAPLTVDLPGRLSASQVAEIRPQVTGLVRARLFTEGSVVRAGQPLYQLDAASFEAEQARSAAALQKAEAQLAAARVKATRDADLLRLDAVSRQVADDSAAAQRQAEADVAVARAALDAAQVQRARARITAPIGGRIEVSSVGPGALVTANQAAALTSIVQLDPMHVDIVQSSSEILALRRQLGADAEAGRSRELQLRLEDGSLHPHPARLQFSGVTVDRGTGAVTLRAVVPNPQGTLLPGMVVQARLQAGVDRGALLVPQQGVSRGPTGEATALVVGADGKAERRRLKLGRAVGNQWLVTAGLQVGDTLIVEGLQRVRPGQAVRAVPAGSPPTADRPASAARAASTGSSAPATKASAAPPPASR